MGQVPLVVQTLPTKNLNLFREIMTIPLDKSERLYYNRPESDCSSSPWSPLTTRQSNRRKHKNKYRYNLKSVALCLAHRKNGRANALPFSVQFLAYNLTRVFRFWPSRT
jgi:hypothetical protein